MNCKFRLLKRGFKDSLVLVPGWATDCRIFSTLELSYNYIPAVKLSPFDFDRALLQLLDREGIKKVSLFGWSLGGFLAVDFALKNPDRIDEMILLGIRRRFDPKALEEARQNIARNKKAFLYKFYLECFSEADKQGLAWFRRHLLKDYLNEVRAEELKAGLDYFSRVTIDSGYFNSLKRIKIFHGCEDRIAPFKEAQGLAEGHRQVEFIPIPGAGHIPFLGQRFKENFKDG